MAARTSKAAGDAGNKVRFGLSNVHVAFHDGTGGFEAPVRIPGAVNLSTTPEGDQSVFYADNSPYYVFNANNGYSVELEMALVPDEVVARMQGWRIDANGGLVETANAEPTPFALLFEVSGDKRSRRTVFYSVTAERPEESNSTVQESKEATTQTISATVVAMDVSGEPTVKYTLELSDSNKAVFDAFYDTVTLPDASAPSAPTE
uniref:Phage tail protein n=1 Tax=Muribaculaceae bacterium Z82 TaxID=2304548 RepID=A0A7C9JF09_9BACT